MTDFDAIMDAVARCPIPVRRGRVSAVGELRLEALLPGARIGEIAEVTGPAGSRIRAEVVACDGDRAALLPFAPLAGIGVGDELRVVASSAAIPCGPGLLGRVVDPFGAPLDGAPLPPGLAEWAVDRPAPPPLARRAVDAQLATGVRAIDGCLALGKGQRVGLFAGPGQGKSTLLATLARRAACDVAVVCLVGERGREVREFLDRAIGAEGLARTAVVVAAADAPPIARAKALPAASAIAEWFRAQGRDVLLLVDSLTRVARARRDAAAAMGEPASRSGYPASALAGLAELIERAGRDERGSITAVYTVLTEGGAEDPVAEEARAALDGHIVLSAKAASAGLWPAIDVVKSISRVMRAICRDAHVANAAALRRLVAAREENEELLLVGAYRAGTSRDTDLAIERAAAIAAFLRQGSDEASSLDETLRRLEVLVRGA
jgi:ATP synthase in type III secretion protein N